MYVLGVFVCCAAVGCLLTRRGFTPFDWDTWAIALLTSCAIWFAGLA